MSDNEHTVWALRVHECDGVDDNSITNFMSKLDGPYLVAKESEANRVHYQGWFISKIKDVTLRARVKKAFPSVVGNNGYSLKPAKDADKYMRYICKGTREVPPVVVTKHGILYTDEWVKNQWEAFWQHEASEAYELKKAKMSVTETIWSKVEQLPEINMDSVVKLIIKCHVAVGKPYDVYGVRKLRNVIMSKYDRSYINKMVIAVNSDDVSAADCLYKNKDVIVEEKEIDI